MSAVEFNEVFKASGITRLTTTRLVLRAWNAQDFEEFAALNTDPEVMKYFTNQLERSQSDQFASQIDAAIRQRGWGLWATEVRTSGDFIGFVGLSEANFDAQFCPCVEVGWRLARRFWGNGYATEAARAALQFGFRELGMGEIYSFTSVPNKSSEAVMKRLGMSFISSFDHPKVPVGHRLVKHVLYRIRSPELSAGEAVYSFSSDGPLQDETKQ